jgi:hypothetical protein
MDRYLGRQRGQPGWRQHVDSLAVFPLVAVAGLLLMRCALTLLVLGLLALPFALSSPLSLTIDLLGIAFNVGLIVLARVALRWSARRARALEQAEQARWVR